MRMILLITTMLLSNAAFALENSNRSWALKFEKWLDDTPELAYAPVVEAFEDEGAGFRFVISNGGDKEAYIVGKLHLATFRQLIKKKARSFYSASREFPELQSLTLSAGGLVYVESNKHSTESEIWIEGDNDNGGAVHFTIAARLVSVASASEKTPVYIHIKPFTFSIDAPQMKAVLQKIIAKKKQ